MKTRGQNVTREKKAREIRRDERREAKRRRLAETSWQQRAAEREERSGVKRPA
jgi:hypothetical protein